MGKLKLEIKSYDVKKNLREKDLSINNEFKYILIANCVVNN